MGKKNRRKKKNAILSQERIVGADSKKSTGLLVTTAREYHLRYAEEIAYEVEYHKHLSVLMPAMIGLHSKNTYSKWICSQNRHLFKMICSSLDEGIMLKILPRSVKILLIVACLD